MSCIPYSSTTLFFIPLYNMLQRNVEAFLFYIELYFCSIESLVISKDFNNESSRGNIINWVWPSFNHAHAVKDVNITI